MIGPLFVLRAGLNLYQSDRAADSILHKPVDISCGDIGRSLLQQPNATRNLVQAEDVMEIIIFCWLPGQASRSHDGSDCFMVTLQGKGSVKNSAASSISEVLEPLRLGSLRLTTSENLHWLLHDSQALHCWQFLK